MLRYNRTLKGDNMAENSSVDNSPVFALLLVMLGIGFFMWVAEQYQVITEKAQGKVTEEEQILGGEHKLRKMTAGQTVTNSKASGGFFLVVGGFKSETKTTALVKFAWEMNDGAYAISSLPLEKIRVKIDEKATTPTIKFRWTRNYNVHDLQTLIDESVCYAVITVKESDWPVQVSLPLSQKVE